MNSVTRLLAAATALFLASCATSRTAFSPQSGPPTVGMPAQLSERERSFVPEVESSLRDHGYLPVRHGSGDLELDFEMAEGPINIDTKIALYDGRKVVAQGNGRAAGAPMIGRSKVAEKSFTRAYSQFQSALPGSARQSSSNPRETSGRPGEEYVY